MQTDTFYSINLVPFDVSSSTYAAFPTCGNIVNFIETAPTDNQLIL